MSSNEDGELPDIASLRKKYDDLPPPEVRINKAKDCKNQGNESFQEKHYESAAKSYQEAIDSIENEWDFSAFEARDAKELRVICHSNLAQCMINVGKYYKARKSCDAALEINDEHAKTLYRRGLAHMHLSAYEAARKDFKCALALEPENKNVQKQLDKLKIRVEKHKMKEKKVFKKAFESLDGVFSENRDDNNIGWFEKCLLWIEKKIQLYGPWVSNILPLLVIGSKIINGGEGGYIPSKYVCSLLFLCIGFLQLRLSNKNKTNWLLPSFLPYRHAISWINGCISVLIGWTMVMSRSSSELSLTSKFGILTLLLNGGFIVLGEFTGSSSKGGSVKDRGLRASSFLMLLALLSSHI